MAAIDGDNSVAFYHINTSEICPDKKEGWTLVESDFIRGKRGGGATVIFYLLKKIIVSTDR